MATSKLSELLWRGALLWLGWLLVLPWSPDAEARERLACWLALRSNQIVDEQVAREVAPGCGVIVLRARAESAHSGYSFPDIVRRLKAAAPGVPLLSYAVVTRRYKGRTIESDLLRNLDLGSPVAVSRNRSRESEVAFLDITNPYVRRSIIERLASERIRLGVDGFAVDLATRTPVERPQPLARICREKPNFCEAYGLAMDDLLARLNDALGDGGIVLFNGLWNFAPGMLEDQARLLAKADAVAIEYFGLNPRESAPGSPRSAGGRDGAFATSVLPYLDMIMRLPQGKPALVFGRGTWGYAHYAEDYRWQRYLYGAFLLGRRAEDLYKYHASFQVPAHAGRAGGLDVYADWSLDLGAPRGPYRPQAGLYGRQFANGGVFVAPVEGAGGIARLETPGFTPEGEQLAGEVRIPPGTALILLNKRVESFPGAPARRITGRQIGTWGWQYLRLSGEKVRLDRLPPERIGEHDVLLDHVRSLAPFQYLRLDATPLEPGAVVLAVAEVDDPLRRYQWTVVELAAQGGAVSADEMSPPVEFRSTARADRQQSWPRIGLSWNTGAGGAVLLDGPELLARRGLRFRRWSHLRLMGPLEISAIELSHRASITE